MARMEKEIVDLRKELADQRKRTAEREGGGDINVRAAKKPRLLTEPKARQFVVGEKATDGTFELIEHPKNPLRSLFSDDSAYGYNNGELPGTAQVHGYLKNKTRMLEEQLSVTTVGQLLNFEWSKVNISDFASKGMTDVKTDRKSFEMALTSADEISRF